MVGVNRGSQLLAVEQLHTSIGGQDIHTGLSLSVCSGEIFGVLGGSGSGKTVLLNTILGLFPRASGLITLFGYDIETVYASFEHRQRLGVLFQRGALFSSLTVVENVMVPMIEQAGVAPRYALPVALSLLEKVGLETRAADKLPEALSGGMVKRVALARALALNADLIFLDEPTSGLDPIAAEAFDQLIVSLKRDLGLTIFMITHDLGSLAICDRLGVIQDKKMIVGTLEEIRAHPDPWIQKYFHGRRSRVLTAKGEFDGTNTP